MAWLRLVADQNFNNHIIRSLRRRYPAIDVVRVRDLGLSSAVDPDVLEWAAKDGRIVISHDRATMADFAWERVSAGLPMPGLFLVPLTGPVNPVVDSLILIDQCAGPEEFEAEVVRLPF